jgi:5'(3')-deoxyribonucleotidase
MTRILIDVDGVLLDFVGALCTQLKARGFDYSPSDIVHWELRESLSIEATRTAFQIMAEPGFCHAIPWYEGASEFFQALQREGEAHVVTAPASGPSWMHERKNALTSGGFPWDRVHFVSGKWKYLIQGDVLIEDHPANAVAWLDANPGGIAVLIDRPWNQPSAREFASHHWLYRAKDYGHALRIVRECFP